MLEVTAQDIDVHHTVTTLHRTLRACQAGMSKRCVAPLGAPSELIDALRLLQLRLVLFCQVQDAVRDDDAEDSPDVSSTRTDDRVEHEADEGEDSEEDSEEDTDDQTQSKITQFMK